ncbi:type I-U CRISPR-associated protein Csx17 [Methylomonas sp. OY6]|uniref:Type I-U CRISPR-associated protein Csx17 n=1 Tax=Methylomonas defluvii TaxID=3045149 RepID=A0ABU4UD65_9GAMM|nr:type I-U CRISPR-associated protein Csx17 [Methylomonas sp. OY6]MDX8127368.1 type I-U CRISPR-associated protein Csx17 [Methylomonas sp. OY6]
MSHEIELKGCAPTPLAYYLKALGILRLVAEQKDPNAKGCWRDEAFVLQSSLDKESLLRFFLDEYRPTPITAPWNGGSGFYFQEGKTSNVDPETGKKLKTGVRDQETEATRTVKAFIDSECDRFAVYRDVLIQIRSLLTKHDCQEAPKAEAKDLMLQIFRNTFPDVFLSWLDAVLLIGTDKTFFPPLLGTGGNDGNLDFTNNFMQRQLQLFDPLTGQATVSSAAWLSNSLFADATPQMHKDAAIGQFFPGNAGGPNATVGFEAKSLINPWDFVLMLEGALLFAANTTRRLQQDKNSSLSYPFTVRMAGGGSGAGNQNDEADSHDEIWLPVWYQATGLNELNGLFQEGRATVGRRPAKDGLDFARAVASLGVDRGITEFQRYGFMMRSGKSYLATPISRIATRANPSAELINDLERNRFLDGLRRFARSDKASARLASLAHQLENRLFDLTRGADRRVCQDILMLLGKIQRTVSISPKAKEDIHQSIPLLSTQWLVASDDASPEFRLACALAGLKAVGGGSTKSALQESPTESVFDTSAGLPMRLHFAGIKLDKKGYVWDNESRLAVWGEGSLTQNLNETLRCRWLAAQRLSHKDKPFAYGVGANQADIAAFLAGSVDDRRISDLVQGLALLKDFNSTGLQTPTIRHAALPAAYALLKPFFVPDRELVRIGLLAADAKLPLRGELLSWLAANQTQKTVDWAWAKLRQVGVGLPHFPQQAPRAVGIDGPRLLAALAFPLASGQLKSLLLTLGTGEKATEQQAESAQ